MYHCRDERGGGRGFPDKTQIVDVRGFPEQEFKKIYILRPEFFLRNTNFNNETIPHVICSILQ